MAAGTESASEALTYRLRPNNTALKSMFLCVGKQIGRATIFT